MKEARRRREGVSAIIAWERWKLRLQNQILSASHMRKETNKKENKTLEDKKKKRG